jgi:long-chain fatty acid transport protein
MKDHGHSFISVTVLAGALLTGSQIAHAAGFYITEVGTPGSLGTAGAANPTNNFGADSAWTNPAGMTGLDGDKMVGGIQVVVPQNKFDSSRADAGGRDGGNAGNALPIPSFFYVKKLNDRARFGFSVTAPQGGGFDYGDDFVGRYAASKSILGVIGLSPSLAYKVNDRFSIGGGVTALYTNYELNIAINSAAIVPGSSDAKAKIENMTDWAYQPFVGLTYQVTDRAMLGVVYRAKSDVNLNGDVNIRNWSLPVPKPKFNDAELSWDNPQWLDVGLKYAVTDKDVLFLNGGWQDWSEFSRNGVSISGGATSIDTEIDREWDDTWYARIGYAHELAPESFFSMGISYDSSPVKNQHRTFDLPVDEYYKLSAGYGQKFRDKLDFALGATLMLVGDADIKQTSQGVTAAGKFDTNYILFLGGTLRYEF